MMTTGTAAPAATGPDAGTTICYRGWLRLTSNGEEDELLAVPGDRDGGPHDYDGDEDRFLAASVRRDILKYGAHLGVRYWTADAELSGDEIKAAALREILGFGDAEYGTQYSETTGYLWTDENVVVGGHNLLAELKAQVGRFAHVEITYNRQPKGS